MLFLCNFCVFFLNSLFETTHLSTKIINNVWQWCAHYTTLVCELIRSHSQTPPSVASFTTQEASAANGRFVIWFITCLLEKERKNELGDQFSLPYNNQLICRPFVFKLASATKMPQSLTSWKLLKSARFFWPSVFVIASSLWQGVRPGVV